MLEIMIIGSEFVMRKSQAMGGFLTILGVWFTWLKFLLPQGPLLGDGGDTKFNLYALEHVYLVVRGRETLWNESFYWPVRGVAAFSEIHLGSSFFYVIFCDCWLGNFFFTGNHDHLIFFCIVYECCSI